MKHLVWKLGTFLESHGATPYQLEVKLRAALALEAERAMQSSRTGQADQSSQNKASSGEKPPIAFSPNTVYKWAKASSVPERIQTTTFERILRALELIAGREVELSEILAWEDAGEQTAKNSNGAKVKKTPSRTRGAT